MAKSRAPERRFYISDAIVLVAATAVGFAAARLCSESWAGLMPIPFFSRGPTRETAEAIARVTVRVPLWLAPWTVALLLLRLRPPRPRRRHLWRRPGFVAGAAATFVLATGAAAIVAVLAYRYLTTWRTSYWVWFLPPLFMHCAFDLRLSSLVGAAVAVGWMTLLLGGRWRAEPVWIDRLGRVLGCCWIALFLMDCLLTPWSYLGHQFQVPPPALKGGPVSW